MIFRDTAYYLVYISVHHLEEKNNKQLCHNRKFECVAQNEKTYLNIQCCFFEFHNL